MANLVYIETLGCAKNRVDSEIMLGCLLDNQFAYTPDPSQARAIVVNTCGFLTSAVNESIERILDLAQYKEEGQCQALVVAGCMAARYREQLLEELPEVDAILGTSDYTQILPAINHVLAAGDRRAWLLDKPLYSPKNGQVGRVLSTEQHYAYLKIAEGCSNMCSFCNIPWLRGYFSSRSPQAIEEEFKSLLAQGIKEINLISQDTSSYGVEQEGQEGLLELVKRLLRVPGEYWIRIFYSYPNRFPLGLFDLMKQDPRLVPYVDLPFQHINDKVLKDMNRKITRAELEKLLAAARSVPGLAVRSTLIVGFPTEGEKEFNELLDFVRQGHFDHLGVFAYSEEENIASTKFGDPWSEEVKEQRRQLVLAAQQQVSLKKNQAQIGQIQKVLVEGLSSETDLLLQARNSTQGVEVDGVILINEGQAQAGQFHQVEILEAHPYDLVGRLLPQEEEQQL